MAQCKDFFVSSLLYCITFSVASLQRWPPSIPPAADTPAESLSPEPCLVFVMPSKVRRLPSTF